MDDDDKNRLRDRYDFSRSTEHDFDDASDESTEARARLRREEKIIDGKAHAKKREDLLRSKIAELNKPISVVSLLIGDDPPSVLYTQLKQKKALAIGIDFKAIQLAETILFDDVVQLIKRLNEDPTIDGMMFQLPLPKKFLQGHLTKELLELIDAEKDIDGLTTSRIVPPAAVKATMALIEEEGIILEGMNCVVLGTSELVGKPMAEELKKKGAVVQVINSKTEHPELITKQAELIVSAVGKPGVLTGDMVQEDVIVFDIGTLVIEEHLDGTLQRHVVGDVDFTSVFPFVKKITPVPGGVGPMTIIALLENCYVLKSTQK